MRENQMENQTEKKIEMQLSTVEDQSLHTALIIVK